MAGGYPAEDSLSASGFGDSSNEPNTEDMGEDGVNVAGAADSSTIRSVTQFSIAVWSIAL